MRGVSVVAEIAGVASNTFAVAVQGRTLQAAVRNIMAGCAAQGFMDIAGADKW